MGTCESETATSIQETPAPMPPGGREIVTDEERVHQLMRAITGRLGEECVISGLKIIPGLLKSAMAEMEEERALREREMACATADNTYHTIVPITPERQKLIDEYGRLRDQHQGWQEALRVRRALLTDLGAALADLGKVAQSCARIHARLTVVQRKDEVQDGL